MTDGHNAQYSKDNSTKKDAITIDTPCSNTPCSNTCNSQLRLWLHSPKASAEVISKLWAEWQGHYLAGGRGCSSLGGEPF